MLCVCNLLRGGHTLQVLFCVLHFSFRNKREVKALETSNGNVELLKPTWDVTMPQGCMQVDLGAQNPTRMCSRTLALFDAPAI